MKSKIVKSVDNSPIMQIKDVLVAASKFHHIQIDDSVFDACDYIEKELVLWEAFKKLVRGSLKMNAINAEDWNEELEARGIKEHLTQEELDLLKEVLK